MPKSLIEGFYKCCKCKEDKPLSEFHKCNRPTYDSPSHHHVSVCKDCRKPIDQARMRATVARNRDVVINHYGGKCTCCGEVERMFLTVEHLNGDGAQHRREIGGGGPKLYAWLIWNNFPPGFTILCASCNLGKYRNGGTCPHQEKLAIVA